MGAVTARYKKWQRRCWAGSVIMMAATIGPLIYCFGWWPVPAGMDGLTLSYCVDTHLLRYPALFFVSSMAFLMGGIVLVNRQRIAEKKEEALERRIKQASGRDSRRTPMLDRAAMRGRAVGVPDEIEVEEGLDLDLDAKTKSQIAREEAAEDPDSLMAFLQEEQKIRAPKVEETPNTARRPESEGFYFPPGMEDAPVLYLDGGVEPTDVVDGSKRINNPDLPHTEIDEAVRHAFQLVMERQEPVIVRVMPGVYQASIEIPDRVTVLNHRIPAHVTVDQRLSWLREQHQVDHPDRVTILTPSEANFSVRILPGQKQGLFGCYLVGRKGVAQTGLKAHKSVALAVVHCAFEGFSRGGGLVEECGEDLPGRKVVFVGCLWTGNASRVEGGGLTIRESVVKIEASIFDSNTAPMGGAIAVIDTENPVTLERSLLQRNRALCEREPRDVANLDMMQWRTVTGLGGGLVAKGGLVRIVDSIFDGNDAAVGGGAVAAVGARVVIKSTGEGRGVCSENRADVGGGLLAVGWPEQAAMIRSKGVEVVHNLAKTSGGGAAGVGRAILHFEDALLRANRASGSRNGVGGGVFVWRAARLQARGLSVVSNQANTRGGGIAVMNAHIKLEEGCTVNRNRADSGGGGGLLVVTLPDGHLERLVGQAGFSLPFKCVLDGVRVSQNKAGGPAGGFDGGNQFESATFPLSIMIRRPDWISENQGSKDEAGVQDIRVQWAGAVKVQDGVRGRVRLALQ